MRTKERFENERIFGIQKFTSPSEAFKTIKGRWTDENVEDCMNIIIMDDEAFGKVIFWRAFLKYCEYKLGKITKSECDYALCKGTKLSDYLLDFNFFLYSSLSNCFYTSRMEIANDLVYQWNERQWDICSELKDLYSFDVIVKDAQDYWKEHKDEITNIDIAREILDVENIWYLEPF